MSAPRLNDTLYNVIDSNTFESTTYVKTQTFFDGTAMTDANVDGIIYTKDNTSGEYFKRILPDGKVCLKWFGTNDAAALNKALVYNNPVVIDVPLYINANVTIAEDKVIEVQKNAVISTTGTNKLLIKGKLIAGLYKIFNVAASVKIRPNSVTEIYPEWFGAIALDNPREAGIAAGSAKDSTAAFKKIFSLVEGSQYLDKAFSALIRISGTYAISDELAIHGGYRLVGSGQEMQGSGLKWIGPGTSAKSMLKFMECEYGGVENIFLRGAGSTGVSDRLKAAIELNWTSGNDTQRGMVFHNITFGNPIGYFYGDDSTVKGGFDFEHGIYCTGTSGNNDFHTLTNLNIANTRIGIRTQTDQSVEWKIENYRMNFGDLMFQSDLGGSCTGERWYAEAVQEGIIKVGGSISQELRMSLMNFSSEYIRGTYFINTEAKIKFSLIGENFVSVNSNWVDQNDGFALIKGGGINYDSEFIFDNTRFEFNTDGTAKTTGYTNPSPRMYIEQLNTAVSFKSLIFRNCTGAKFLYFRFPGVYNGNNSTYSIVQFIGEKNIDYGISPNFYQQNKVIAVNARDTAITQGIGARWLYLQPLFNGETDILASTINFGEKGKTPMIGLINKAYKAVTLASLSQTLPGILPAKSLIKGVSVLAADSNILTTGFNYVSVGIAQNDSLFGFIQMPNIGAYNSKSATYYTTSDGAPEDLILKGWLRYPDSTVYYLAANGTVTSSNASFAANQVGGVIRFLSGTYANQDFLITGFTNSQTITVANPNGYTITSPVIATIQVPLNAGKQVVISLNYEEVGRYREYVDVNFTNQLPSLNLQSAPVVLNQNKVNFQGVDESQFAKKSDVSGSVDILKDNSYTVDGVPFTSKASIQGASKDYDDSSKIAFTVLDSLGRPVMNVDNAGRENLFSYTSNGSVMVLYNETNPDTDFITAGHYAFGAKNRNGGLNTIVGILADTISRIGNNISSEIVFSYMDNADTSAGYTQPNKQISISKNGFILPNIPLLGISQLQVLGTVTAAPATLDAELVTKGQIKAAAQADSTATTIAGLRDDFNSLLAKMRNAGLLAS